MFKKKKEEEKWKLFVDTLSLEDYLSLNVAMIEKNKKLNEFAKKVLDKNEDKI